MFRNIVSLTIHLQCSNCCHQSEKYAFWRSAKYASAAAQASSFDSNFFPASNIFKFDTKSHIRPKLDNSMVGVARSVILAVVMADFSRAVANFSRAFCNSVSNPPNNLTKEILRILENGSHHLSGRCKSSRLLRSRFAGEVRSVTVPWSLVLTSGFIYRLPAVSAILRIFNRRPIRARGLLSGYPL